MRQAVLAIALVAAPLFADEVRLKGGGRLSGQILEETADTITVDIGAGKATVPTSSVVGIDRSTSPLQEYRARAAVVAPNDIEGWRKLARWANDYGLSAQAREAYSHVRTAHPDDAEANRALGLVLFEGKWVTEEQSYQARGFVKVGSEWMMPAERDAMAREQVARDEANRQAVAADIKATEASIKEREAQVAKEDEEARRRRNSLPMLGDASYWGYGPAVWPGQP